MKTELRKVRRSLWVALAISVVAAIGVFVDSHTGARFEGERVRTLIKELGSEDPEVQSRAELILSTAGPRAIPGLIKALDARNPSYREKCNSLKLNMPDVLDWMVPYIEDRAVARASAANVLGSFGGSARAAVPKLSKLLGDDNDIVRLSAINALGAIGPGAKEAIPDLLGLLKSGDLHTRVVTAGTLWKIDPKEYEPLATPVLVEGVGAGSYVTTEVAISVLEQMGKVELVVPPLLEQLKASRPSTRNHGALSLYRLGPKAKVAVPALTEALSSTNIQVRTSAARVLGNIGPEARSALPALYEARKIEEERIGALYPTNDVRRQLGPWPIADAIKKIEGPGAASRE